jgi:hypothetical protein
MRTEFAVAALKEHCIECETQDGHVFALEVSVAYWGGGQRIQAIWLDVTDWTVAKLMAWLGY